VIKAIVFDIGPVLFRIDYDSVIDTWASITGLSAEHIRSKFVYAEEHKAFERGEISEADFAAFVARSIEHPLSVEDFRTGWNALLKEVWPGLLDLIVQLKPHYQVVCLSNTNITHVNAFKIHYTEVLALLDQPFYSHEIGAIKPSKAAFDQVLDYLKLEPQEVIFFDDLEENVEGARKLGIEGCWVKEYPIMKKRLEELLDIAS